MMAGYELYVIMNDKSLINFLPITHMIHILWYVKQKDVQSKLCLCKKKSNPYHIGKIPPDHIHNNNGYKNSSL